MFVSWCQMKSMVSAAASNFTSSLTSVGQSTYVGQQQSTTPMYGGSSLQQPTSSGSGSSGSMSGGGTGGQSSQYQYYSGQTQQQQQLSQNYNTSQVHRISFQSGWPPTWKTLVREKSGKIWFACGVLSQFNSYEINIS